MSLIIMKDYHSDIEASLQDFLLEHGIPHKEVSELQTKILTHICVRQDNDEVIAILRDIEEKEKEIEELREKLYNKVRAYEGRLSDI